MSNEREGTELMIKVKGIMIHCKQSVKNKQGKQRENDAKIERREK